MQEDEFFDNLNFETLRDYTGGPEVNQYQVYLDECAIKGKVVFIANGDDEELTLYSKELFIATEFSSEECEEVKNFDASHDDFVLIGDEYAEGINDPDELEDALNSWGVY